MTTPQSRAKARGRETENMVVGYLNEHGYPYAERRRLKGSADQGDITGIPGVVIEVKGDRSNRIAEWRRETITEARNASADVAFLIVRVERKPVGEWDAHIPARLLFSAPLRGSNLEDVWVRMDLQDMIATLPHLDY